MQNVRIQYADVPYALGLVRVIRFPNTPVGPTSFTNPGEALEPDPNEHLPERIKQEVTSLFNADEVLLFFDSMEMVFHNDDVLRHFPAHMLREAAYDWKTATLQVQYQ